MSVRVLFTTLRTPSHFLPLVPFVEACLRRGHEVAVAAPQDLEANVAKTGATFLPFGHPGDAGLAPVWARMRTAPESESKRIAIGELFAGICAKTALPGLLQTMTSFRPAVVIRESQEYAGIVAAAKAGVPHARVAITSPGVELGFQEYAIPSVNAHGLEVGLPPDPSGERIREEPILTLFPKILECGETVPGAVLRFRAERPPAPPLPDYWSGNTDPFVYATLGTVAGTMDVAKQAYRTVVEACSGMRARVLLTIGSGLPMDALGEVPPNVHVERFVPQDDVLPHAAAAICHGGSGTMIGALAAGVPMVVAPMFADQPNNAERVAKIGAGIALPTRGATAESIRDALTRLLSEPSFRKTAESVAKEIAELPAVDAAGAEIERLARG